MTREAIIAKERTRFFAALKAKGVLIRDLKGIPSNADKDNVASIRIANGILEQLGSVKTGKRLPGQRSGNLFESICASFTERCFGLVQHLRPGEWSVHQTGGHERLQIAQYEQYAHLVALDAAARENAELAAALGSDYTITPDIVIARHPVEDEEINARKRLVDERTATYASLRKRFSPKPILHASISCKWTIRSDRAQNSRSEGLNLVRNRKGRLPHIMVITGEPTPGRIASIALGTGDIDCVYHFALPELRAAVEDAGLDDSREMLDIMVGGMRLRDISDLPLDLAV